MEKLIQSAKFSLPSNLSPVLIAHFDTKYYHVMANQDLWLRVGGQAAVLPIGFAATESPNWSRQNNLPDQWASVGKRRFEPRGPIFQIGPNFSLTLCL